VWVPHWVGKRIRTAALWLVGTRHRVWSEPLGNAGYVLPSGCSCFRSARVCIFFSLPQKVSLGRHLKCCTAQSPEACISRIQHPPHTHRHSLPSSLRTLRSKCVNLSNKYGLGVRTKKGALEQAQGPRGAQARRWCKSNTAVVDTKDRCSYVRRIETESAEAAFRLLTRDLASWGS
jgi:hypothetical protein